MKQITDEKLDKYFSITKEALDMAKPAMDQSRLDQAKDFLIWPHDIIVTHNFFVIKMIM